MLEKLSRTHIALPLSIFYGAGAIILFTEIYRNQAAALMMAGLFFTGLLTWTFVEYIGHRYLFHLAETSEFRKKLVHTIHGVHHEYPRDKYRLAMPPVISVIVMGSLLWLFYSIAGNLGLTLGGGFLAGYASYLVVHYSVHTMVPPKNFLNYLWLHHSIHHYKDQSVAFGVSSPLWDFIFGTMPPEEWTSRKPKGKKG